jgi:hypothetical protein
LGASGWDYHVPYQPDLRAAFDHLRRQILTTGDYWWATGGGTAADFPDRPATMRDLWADETVQQEGTHSILDMSRIGQPGETPAMGTVQPVTEDEALARTGTAKPTRAHVEALDPLVEASWSGRCAVLYDDAGEPAELYFWGISGD